VDEGRLILAFRANALRPAGADDSRAAAANSSGIAAAVTTSISQNVPSKTIAVIYHRVEQCYQRACVAVDAQEAQRPGCGVGGAAGRFRQWSGRLAPSRSLILPTRPSRRYAFTANRISLKADRGARCLYCIRQPR
jgi:hypothetical protein